MSFKFDPRMIVVSLFNLLVLLTPLYFRFSTSELFEFNKMLLVYTLTILIATFWVVRMIMERKVFFKPTPYDLPILLFVGTQLISTILSIHPRTSLLGYYSRFNGGLLSTISYVVLFYAFVNNFKKSDLKGLFLSTFISAGLVSVYSIFEHFGRSFSCLLAPGAKSFAVDCWIQDVQHRVFATFGQPNWLATYLVSTIWISFVLAIKKQGLWWQKVFFALVGILMFASLIFTKSRSGFLGFITGGGIFTLGLGWLWFEDKSVVFKKVDQKVLGFVILAITTLTLVFGTPYSPTAFEIINNSQVKTVEPDDELVVNRLEVGGTDSGEIRKIVWSGALDVWKRYPLTGSGVETFAYSYYQDRPREHNDVSEWDFLYNKAHNEFLNMMATTGIFGLLANLSLFVVFTGICLKLLMAKQAKNTESDHLHTKILTIALLSGVAAMSVANFFGFSTVVSNAVLFIFFAIITLLYQNLYKVNNKLKNKQKVSKRTTYDFNDGGQMFAISLVAIVSFFLLFRVYNYYMADQAYAIGKNNFLAGNYQLGIEKQLEAIERSPREALFYDTLSDDYSKLAIHFYLEEDVDNALVLLNESIKASNSAIQLNSRHLNFYKTRIRVMINLAQIDESLLEEARRTSESAIELAPTDARLVYTLAIIELALENEVLAVELLKKSIELKPDYQIAILKLEELSQAN